MQSKKIFAVSGIVLATTVVLLVAAFFGWQYFGPRSKCEGSLLPLVEQAAKAKEAADAAARRAATDKSERTQESARLAARNYEEVKADLMKQKQARERSLQADKSTHARLWSSCR